MFLVLHTCCASALHFIDGYYDKIVVMIMTWTKDDLEAILYEYTVYIPIVLLYIYTLQIVQPVYILGKWAPSLLTPIYLYNYVIITIHIHCRMSLSNTLRGTKQFLQYNTILYIYIHVPRPVICIHAVWMAGQHTNFMLHFHLSSTTTKGTMWKAGQCWAIW